jgi:hypothetical protein
LGIEGDVMMEGDDRSNGSYKNMLWRRRVLAAIDA